jgi:N-acetylglucosaminyldiphosphoundecaprenol N-acetyl-beta-D-mannosaminyltransferase
MADVRNPHPGPRRVPLLGCAIDAVTEDEAVTRIMGWCRDGDGGCRTVITLNAAVVTMLRGDPVLRAAVGSADLVLADGMPLVWAARWLGTPLPGRVTGVDLMTRLLDAGRVRGLRVFLLGTTQERLDRMVAVVGVRHPGVVVAGARNGYFAAAEHAEVAAQIRAARADLLLLGMPTPAKEIWCARHRDVLATPVALGVGGAFDVLAGCVRRAPTWMQAAGLEWLWRLAMEPRRLWRRYLVSNTRFAALLAVAMAARLPLIRRNPAITPGAGSGPPGSRR